MVDLWMSSHQKMTGKFTHVQQCVDEYYIKWGQKRHFLFHRGFFTITPCTLLLKVLFFAGVTWEISSLATWRLRSQFQCPFWAYHDSSNQNHWHVPKLSSLKMRYHAVWRNDLKWNKMMWNKKIWYDIDIMRVTDDFTQWRVVWDFKSHII